MKTPTSTIDGIDIPIGGQGLTAAGVHSSTMRRGVRAGLIPAPVARRKRKLYWTPGDAWLVQVYSMPGVYHAEQRNPVESNSTGPDVTPSNEIESI